MKPAPFLFRQLFAIALFVVLPTGHSWGAKPGMPEGWSDGYVYANGARLHYYRAVPTPEKPDLLMVHGVTDIGLCWLLGVCFWRKVREERVWAEFMGEKGGWWSDHGWHLGETARNFLLIT